MADPPPSSPPPPPPSAPTSNEEQPTSSPESSTTVAVSSPKAPTGAKFPPFPRRNVNDVVRKDYNSFGRSKGVLTEGEAKDTSDEIDKLLQDFSGCVIPKLFWMLHSQASVVPPLQFSVYASSPGSLARTTKILGNTCVPSSAFCSSRRHHLSSQSSCQRTRTRSTCRSRRRDHCARHAHRCSHRFRSYTRMRGAGAAAAVHR